MHKKTSIILLTLISSICFAQEEKDKSWINGVSIAFEQDFLLDYLTWSDLNSDQNYTQGLDVRFYSNLLAHAVNKRVFKDTLTDVEYFDLPASISLKLAAFTPNDLRQSAPVVGDRPYSTLAAVEMQATELATNSKLRTNVAKQKTFLIGFLGWQNVAERLQTNIHNSMNNGNTKDPYNPEGWDNQISDGGELTLMYQQRWTRPFTSTNDKIFTASQGSSTNSIITYNYGYSLLYNTGAFIGLDYKFGRIRIKNWYNSYGNNLSNISNFSTSPKNTPAIKEDGSEINNNTKAAKLNSSTAKYYDYFFFANLQSQVVLYNASLHGQIRNTNYRLEYSQTGFIVNNLRFGGAFESKCLKINLYWAFRSPEMWNTFSRVHSWGGLDIGYNF